MVGIIVAGQKMNLRGHFVMTLLDLPLEVIARITTTPEIYAAIRSTSCAFANIKFTAELDYYFYDSLRDWTMPRAMWLAHIKRNLCVAPKLAWVYSVKLAHASTYAPMHAHAHTNTTIFMIASTRDRVQLRAFIAATA